MNFILVCHSTKTRKEEDFERGAKISIGMHRVVKLKISRIPLIGLEARLG
jgi:hypothetical protein